MSIHPDLVGLLTAVSENFHDHTAKLVAADWCQDHDPEYTALEWLLRDMVNPSWIQIPLSTPYPHLPRCQMDACLFTGSRRYGKPKPESDFDWVLSSTLWYVNELRRRADHFTEFKLGEDATNGVFGCDVALRFGPVNVLAVTTETQWQAWKTGTEELAERKPVTREEAIETFQRLFNSFGLLDSDEEWSGDSPDVNSYDPPWAEHDGFYS